MFFDLVLFVWLLFRLHINDVSNNMLVSLGFDYHRLGLERVGRTD